MGAFDFKSGSSILVKRAACMPFDMNTDLKWNGWDSDMNKGMKRIKERHIKESPDSLTLSRSLMYLLFEVLV